LDDARRFAVVVFGAVSGERAAMNGAARLFAELALTPFQSAKCPHSIVAAQSLRHLPLGGWTIGGIRVHSGSAESEKNINESTS
jgi:hypothetical protein